MANVRVPAAPHTCTTMMSVLISTLRAFVHSFGATVTGLPLLSLVGANQVAALPQITSIEQDLLAGLLLGSLVALAAFLNCSYEYLGTKG